LFLGKVRILQRLGFPAMLRPGNLTGGLIVGFWLWLVFPVPFLLHISKRKELGGNIKKGEKGLQVIKFGTFETEDQNTGEEKTFGYLKLYTVFNISQCEGLQIPEIETRPVIEDTCEEAKRIVEGMPNPPVIKFGTATAFYRPSDDSVHMPNIQDMTSPESFWGNLTS